MKLAIILSTNHLETNWNAFRLANLALNKGDTASVFLVGEGVEYEKNSSNQFDIRKQESTKECPAGSLEDWYRLVAENDRVLPF